MKKLLATTALAVIATTGAANSQSVLERVLSQIDNANNLAQVNGTFANIAENLGGGAIVVYNQIDDGAVVGTISEDTYKQGLDAAVTAALGSISYDPDTNKYVYDDEPHDTMGEAVSAATADATETYAADFVRAEVSGGGIDGSITNIVDGISEATQQALADSSVSAIEWNMPTLNFGDMSTTALGAVNTGDITLGVNSTVDEAKTTSTQAVSSVMEQLGGADGTGALVLNIASNMTGVNGSIMNNMAEINGTIANLSTTALGAVNTGTIVSGVNAAVTGITGKSGAN